MTPTEMGVRAVELRRMAKKIPDPNMGNYRDVLKAYKELLDEMLELLWHIASRNG